MLLVHEPEKWNIAKRGIHKIYRGIYREPMRRVLLNKVFQSAPSLPVNHKLQFSVHTLICKRDLLMGICSAKSLNLACNQSLAWVFHDDGTLGENECNLINEHFPESYIVPYEQSEKYCYEFFQEYPKIMHYRSKLKLMLKLLDIARWAKGSRLLFVDTDILFFSTPEFLINRVKDTADHKSYFNKDIDSAYVFSSEVIKSKCGVDIFPRINSGLFVVDKQLFNFGLIDKWLSALPLDQPFIMHRLEQTLFAILASDSKNGVDYLPDEYNTDYHKKVDKSVCKHYVGKIRHGFELEGLKFLLEKKQFRENWNHFASKITR